ncbi:heavy-metal-associated domain-containing protein [Abyssalbus ytuae]|uniref:Heavy-metal-associated domain-containing protein n=1 Tax=Abyssalbus ytuae TaxID=2926907 RepID=A0A9E6ZMQ1_9FLAO|nr:heavy-metal-associated domain-containing protein [Abyssalbus ytuae]UOB18704.1 heavy-metal-associated domain-containing protein [Abyssalbus ytuae]
MKKIVLLLGVILTTFSLSAQEKLEEDINSIVVKGNCEMCKQRIEKAALSVTGVSSAIWELESHILYYEFDENMTSEAEIKKAISKAGHVAQDLVADEEAYKNLPRCCKYTKKFSNVALEVH